MPCLGVVVKTAFASIIFTLVSQPAHAGVPDGAILKEMAQTLSVLHTKDGWQSFLTQRKNQCPQADQKNPLPSAIVQTQEYEIDGEKINVGISCRSQFIAAVPKIVVQVVNDPRHFQDLYGLDKPAALGPVNPDGSFQARIFKLVPGIETQDYTLEYKSHWEDETWIQSSSFVKDEKHFALRDNMKIIEPSGSGSVFKEISLFYPKRWWVRLFNSAVRKITVRELAKLNKSIKCAAEKVQSGAPMTSELAQTCHQEAIR